VNYKNFGLVCQGNLGQQCQNFPGAGDQQRRIVFVMIYCPCIATIAAMKKKTGLFNCRSGFS
jgi:Fe2+ transport system protein B